MPQSKNSHAIKRAKVFKLLSIILILTYNAGTKRATFFPLHEIHEVESLSKEVKKALFFFLLPFFSTETAFITKGHEQVREHHLRTNVDGTPKTSQFATFPEVIVFFVIFPSAVFRLHVYKLPGTPPSSLPTLSCELQATSVDHPDSPHTLI